MLILGRPGNTFTCQLLDAVSSVPLLYVYGSVCLMPWQMMLAVHFFSWLTFFFVFVFVLQLAICPTSVLHYTY